MTTPAGRYQLLREHSDGRCERVFSFPVEGVALVYMRSYAREHCYPDQSFVVWDSIAHREIARAGSLWHDNEDGRKPWPPRNPGVAMQADLYRKITGGKW